MDGGSLLFQKRPRTKQETILLFWLVVATSVWNLEEVSSHVALVRERRSECARTNTNTSTHNGGNVWHAFDKQRPDNGEPPMDVMRSDH